MNYEVEYWLDNIGLPRAYYNASFNTKVGAKNFLEAVRFKGYGALLYKIERLPL